MDVDKFVKEYQSEIAPTAPTVAPGTSLRRDVPIRAPSVAADVGVPFLLALASATVTFAAVGIVAIALRWSVGVPAVAAALALFFVWFWRLMKWESLLWATERITGVDIDRDGKVGEPGRRTVQLEISNPEKPSGLQYLNVPEEMYPKLIEVASRVIMSSTPFSQATMTGKGRPLSRNEFNDLRDLFVARGVAVWRDENHPQRGIRFTPYGMSVMRRLLEKESAAYARMRTQRGTKSLPAHNSRGAGEEEDWDHE